MKYNEYSLRNFGLNILIRFNVVLRKHMNYTRDHCFNSIQTFEYHAIPAIS